MTKDEAMKLALEAMERYQVKRQDFDRFAEEITALREALAEQPAQQEPKFFTHNVERPYDWSEWVCPDPKGYLLKCCDCGLVHEVEFGVVRYKSATEREDCEPVEDPNLQTVFRMRRSEQWSPADTAHRSGGLPMEQPAQRTWVGLTDEEIARVVSLAGFAPDWVEAHIAIEIVRVLEAKLKEKNT